VPVLIAEMHSSSLQKCLVRPETPETMVVSWSFICTLVTLTIFFGLVPSSLINISRWVVQSYL
jgi:hypothetical protein